ncbi:AAA-like domain-containing protein [Deltaproteobacteria bacterium TL4]
MMFFNTSGPVNPSKHYCLSPLQRLDLKSILNLLEEEKYFVLHAPRQTGKTSCLLALRDYLNTQGRYRCLYINVEVAQAAREHVERAIRAILNELASRAELSLKDRFLKERFVSIFEQSGADAALNEALSQWSQHSPLPLVLLMDEVDSLVGDSLISVLRQLRSGYDKRPQAFPQSIVLCGVRDVRDYRMHQGGKEIITGGSAFNIKDKSLRLGNFTQKELEQLYLQHTQETGQSFAPEALQRAWELTQGQPWLLNALAQEVCFEIPEGQNRAHPITLEMMEQAKEHLILRRDTHLDQLSDKLKEERIKRVILPILLGEEVMEIPEDDLQYAEDLGLIQRRPQLKISNPIYQEIIPRMLTSSVQQTIVQESLWYLQADGSLDIDKLLHRFQEFFRENADAWIERFDYKEAGPHLLLQAFLQRIINGGGQVNREYGLGMRRVDLLLIWNYPGGKQKVVIELKLLRQNLEFTLKEALPQTADYMDLCGLSEGHLLIFDRTPGKLWEEKIFRKHRKRGNHSIKVWGM